METLPFSLVAARFALAVLVLVACGGAACLLDRLLPTPAAARVERRPVPAADVGRRRRVALETATLGR